MTSYVTRNYDFFNAITAPLNLESPKYKGFAIDSVEQILGNMSIVKTTHGNFCCESFEDDDAVIYMRVTTFV